MYFKGTTFSPSESLLKLSGCMLENCWVVGLGPELFGSGDYIGPRDEDTGIADRRVAFL